MKSSFKEKIFLIMDALLYGDGVTKRYLYGIIFLSILGLGLIITTLLGGGMIYGISAMLVALLDLIWWQSKSLTSEELKKQSDKERYIKEKSLQKLQRAKLKEEKAKEKLEKEQEKQAEKTDDKNKNKVEKALGKAEENNFDITSEEIKYMLKTYRVKKDHREVIIDSCESLGLKEAPAYIWADRKKYYFLIVNEEEPIKLDYPLTYNLKLYYESGVKADPDNEYKKFKGPSIVSLAFSPFLPDYYEKRNFTVTGFYKNLYRLGKDMYFTNTSAKNVLDITGANFEVSDDVTEDMRHGEDFKNAYKGNLLWRDGVLSSKEYKNLITGLLSNLARADLVPEEFEKILEQMYEYNFITKAYMKFYMDYTQKLKTGKKKNREA